MKDVIDSVIEDIKKLKQCDVAVIWGGGGAQTTLGKNNSREPLKHLCNFVKNNQKVNTVVMTAPPRYDLLPLCVNNGVTSFNRQLRKRIAPYNNVKILYTGLERGYFTKHGLLMNSYGKECIAQRLAIAVGSFLRKKKVSPISLYWKDDTLFPDLTGNECNTMADPQPHLPISPKESSGRESQDPSVPPNKKNENEVKNDHPQLNKRQRNKPAPKNQYFLWPA